MQGLEARKAARATLGVKKMGLLDDKLFAKIAKQKYSKGDQSTKARELSALCRQYIGDPEWHPFKIIDEHGVSKVCMLSELS